MPSLAGLAGTAAVSSWRSSCPARPRSPEPPRLSGHRSGTSTPIWGPAHLPPGGKGQFVVQAKNYGDTASSGTVTVSIDLPDGVTVYAPKELDSLEFSSIELSREWECPLDADGLSTLTCTTEKPIEPRGTGDETGFAPRLRVPVQVDPGAPPTSNQVATISGGGAEAPATDTDPVTISDVPDRVRPGAGLLQRRQLGRPVPAGRPRAPGRRPPVRAARRLRLQPQMGDEPVRLPRTPLRPDVDEAGRPRQNHRHDACRAGSSATRRRCRSASPRTSSAPALSTPGFRPAARRRPRSGSWTSN